MLEIKNVCFSYQSQKEPVVKDFFEQFKDGESVMVVGDNGSGKSTLGKLICGILIPHKGNVYLGGSSLTKLTPKKRIKLAYYISQVNQLQFLSSTLATEIRSLERQSYGTFDKSIYNCFFLPEVLEYNPFELSVNQAWRFSLYLSTIINPKVLFVDEIPSPSNERNLQVLKYLLELRKANNGITFFSYQRKIKLNFERFIFLDNSLN